MHQFDPSTALRLHADRVQRAERDAAHRIAAAQHRAAAPVGQRRLTWRAGRRDRPAVRLTAGGRVRRGVVHTGHQAA